MPLHLFQGTDLSTDPGRRPGSHLVSWEARPWFAIGERAQEFTAMAWRMAWQTQETPMSQFFSLIFQTVKGKDTDSCWPWTGCSEVASGWWEPERSQRSLKSLGTSSFNVGNCLKQQTSLQIWAQPARSFSRIAPIFTTMAVVSVLFSFRFERKLTRNTFCHGLLGFSCLKYCSTDSRGSVGT